MISIDELPIVQNEGTRGMSAVAWAEERQDEIRNLLAEKGAG